MARKRLGEILIQAGVLDNTSLRAALVEQQRWGGQLGRILVDMNIITEEVLVQALSHQLNFPVVNLDRRTVPSEILDLVPGELAEQYNLIPFSREGRFLDVAMSEPTNMGIIDEVQIRTKLNVRSYLAGPKQIIRALAKYYGRGAGSFGLGADPRAPSTGMQQLPPTVNIINLDGTGEKVNSGSVVAPLPGALKSAPRATPSYSSSGDPSASGTLAPPAKTAVTESAAPRESLPEIDVPDRGASPPPNRDVASLQERISKLEALVNRDENVLRKLLALLIEKGVASREEILERIK